MTPEVTIKPGYRVPPVTRPSGCHVPVIALQHLYGSYRRNAALTVIEPIPKVVEPVLNEVFGGTEVKPRIDCSDRLISFKAHSRIEGWGGPYIRGLCSRILCQWVSYECRYVRPVAWWIVDQTTYGLPRTVDLRQLHRRW